MKISSSIGKKLNTSPSKKIISPEQRMKDLNKLLKKRYIYNKIVKMHFILLKKVVKILNLIPREIMIIILMK